MPSLVLPRPFRQSRQCNEPTGRPPSGKDTDGRAIRRFGAQFLVVSAGFDTHKDDPIGGFGLTIDVYPEIGMRLGKLGLPTVICQEGGYRGSTLGRCCHGFLSGFLRGRH